MDAETLLSEVSALSSLRLEFETGPEDISDDTTLALNQLEDEISPHWDAYLCRILEGKKD